MTARRHFAAWASAVALLGALDAAPAPARADDASEAQLQFEMGLERYQQRRWLEAVERFTASYRLVPNGNVAFNVAQSYSRLDRSAEAYNWCETVLGGEASEDLRTRATALRDRLGPRVAVIDVVSDPPGAEIFVDRVDLGARGVAPRRIAVEPGARRVILRLAAHHEVTVEANAAAGTVAPVRGELAPIVGRVSITSEPAGAVVRLEADGRELGTTPLDVELPVGRHRLLAALAGHREARSEITIDESGTVRTLSMSLDREQSARATLTVTGTPAGARVRLGDRDLGTVPLTIGDLDPGRSEVEISAPDLDPYRRTAVLEPGSVTRIAVRLRPPPEWSWPTLRWIMYGTAAASLITGGIFGALALSAHDEFFANPTRETYDAVPARALIADITLGGGLLLAATTFVLDLLLTPPLPSEGRMRIER